MLPDPGKDLGEAEFVTVHRSADECIASFAFDFDVKAVAAQENVGSGDGYALIAIEKSVVVAERLH